MALGASGKRLAPGLFREVLALSGFSSLLGIAAGFPFVFILWNGFRLFIVDSVEMQLKLDFRCLYLSAVFFVIVVAFSCFTAYCYLKRTNIIDIVREEHKNEPVRELGKWCGPVGFVLIIVGAVCGYEAPVVSIVAFHRYPSPLINLFYMPAFAGLYMVMLHTVVHGWHFKLNRSSHKNNKYKNLISRSMMKFQGKQTVNNLIVCTILIAGSVFGIFYIPMMYAGLFMDLQSRPFDYCYHYRMDQDVPGQDEIDSMASKYGLSIKDFRECPYLTLGMDGMVQVEEGRSFHYEHKDLTDSGKFLSETGYKKLIGEDVSVKAGQYSIVSTTSETDSYFYNNGATFLTNMVTRDTLPIVFSGYTHYDFLSGKSGYYILNDADYEAISSGITPDWEGKVAFFNIDGVDSYDFALDFFYTFVASFGPECEHIYYYDRVQKIAAEEAGEVYWGDTDRMTKIYYSSPDTTDFRSYWTYMPKSRVLDRSDFLRNYAVFLMMFLFIAIICILAAVIISYTRCMTIAINNRYVFDDLRRLGASPSFLKCEVKNQAGLVFKVPSFVGMGAMYFLYGLLMFGNDGMFSASEIAGLAACFGILLLIGSLFYLTYRYTVKRMCTELKIV